MSFLKSAINQVGRDMGKVVSNQIFKDGHATPYRRTNASQTGTTRRTKSEFDKAISFQTGHRPSTLVSKVSGIYTVIKNEANYYISDGYLDVDESDNLFLMLDKFNQKIDDVCDILELDEDSNKKEIDQLCKLVEKTNSLFKQTLQVSAEGCSKRKVELEVKSESIENLSFLKYVGLHAVWMGNYAKTGEKKIGATILANLASLMLFPIIHICATIYGILTYSNENKKTKNLKNTYKRMAELQEQRAEAYLNFIK